ncbi:Transcriptional regulator, HxlR family [hydrothermal vent metagenome]|uniref:Transcriptional regulator, HxlR family n=1 Tax=hydrothermal vent metagenome TaxID=652676 RepID=A0A3B0YJA4_9ZZZZ
MVCDAKARRSKCPVTFALDQLGDKWSLLVVRDLMFHGKRTYGEFLESDEGIATNVLADRLKRLEAEGSIEKARDPDNKRRVLYSLTSKGFDLAPLLVEMVLWSAKHDVDTGVPKELIDWLQNDREGFIQAVREGMKI